MNKYENYSFTIKKNVVFVFLKRLNSKKESIKQTNKQTLDNK